MKMKDELERQRELKEMNMTKWRTDSIYKPSHVVRQHPTEYKALPLWVWGLIIWGNMSLIVGAYCLVFWGGLI
jgi:hypothetical protein